MATIVIVSQAIQAPIVISRYLTARLDRVKTVAYASMANHCQTCTDVYVRQVILVTTVSWPIIRADLLRVEYMVHVRLSILIRILCKSILILNIKIFRAIEEILNNIYISCNCQPGYTGRYCDQILNACTSSSCQNGASCYTTKVKIMFIHIFIIR